MMRESLMAGASSARTRSGLIAAGLAANAAIGYLHYRSGLDYEFHIFFLLTPALVTWWAGWLPGALVAVAAVLVWGITDWHLGDGTQNHVALLFNSVTRLGVYLVMIWLLARLRIVLARESVLAHQDPLTGLPNRRMFYAVGERLLAQARRRPEPFTAMFIDLDGFKQVNDELGHRAGDTVLCAVAEVLRQQARCSDIVGRLGGDEFALVLPGMAGEAAAAYAENLRQRLLQQMAACGWPITFSIGVACFRHLPHTIDVLVARADALMYDAKRDGKNTIFQVTIDDPGGIIDADPARVARSATSATEEK